MTSVDSTVEPVGGQLSCCSTNLTSAHAVERAGKLALHSHRIACDVTDGRYVPLNKSLSH
jgi:hypothetical protein